MDLARDGHLGLQQIEMTGVAHLQLPTARDRRIGVDQVRRVQQAAAVVALVAARADVAAVRTGALDIAVGQEAAVIDRIDHPVDPLLDQAVVLQHFREMLRQAAVGVRGRTAEPVVAEVEGLSGPLLDLVLFVAIGAHVLAGGGGGQLGRSAVLVGGADIEHFVPLPALEPRPDVGRQHRTRQVPQVLDAVDVGQRRGDEDAGHGSWRVASGEWRVASGEWRVASVSGDGWRSAQPAWVLNRRGRDQWGIVSPLATRHSPLASRRAMRTNRPVSRTADTRLAMITAQTRPLTPIACASHQPSGIMIKE